MHKINFLSEHFRRAKKILDTEGWAGLLLKAIHRILRRPFISRAYVLARQFRVEPIGSQPREDIQITELKENEPDEVEAVASFGFYGHSKADILHFLAEGQKCWIAKYNGRVVSCIWVLKGVFYDAHLKRYLKLADNEEYLLGAFTLPDFRGMGIVPDLHSQSSLYRFRNNPLLREFAIVRIDNKSSLASCYKEGFKIVGKIGFIEMFGFRLNYLLGHDAFPEISKRILLQFFV